MTDRPNNPEKRFDLFWLLSSAAITAVAVFLRFFQLGLKPFHHDEGVNGFFLTTLFNGGGYKYDPANYHGPTLYYIALAFANASGLDTVTVRWSVAVFGVLTVVLALFLRRHIGTAGALAAALFLAISPGMVFISRYFIHEMLFVFLSLALVVSMIFFIDRGRAGPFAIGWMVLLLLVCFLPSTLELASSLAGENSGMLWALRAAFFVIESALVAFVVRMLMLWNDGRPIYFLLAVASAALMFATKETAFITIGTVLIATLCVWIWWKIYRPARAIEATEDAADDPLSWTNFRSGLGSGSDTLLLAAASAALFIYIILLFFSSFFSYSEGVKGFFEAYAIWSKTGSKDHTQNGFWAYLVWAWKVEAPILILAAAGTALAFVKRRHKFAVFAGLWAFGLMLAYSLIPYKTPWLALSFLLPMCIAAGYAINELVTAGSSVIRIVGYAALAGAAAVLGYQSYDVNFVRYDDENVPYVYAHTRREFLGLVEEIHRYAAKSGNGEQAVIEVVSPDYWPLVWYVKDYKSANFHGRIVDVTDAEMIIAKKGDQDDDVVREYSAGYKYAGTFDLRPGVELMLLVRKDLAEPDALELYRIADK